MKRLISVIVPVFNAEQYLAQCIESILNQTLKEIEIILVDDGSKDHSAQIYNEYAQKDERIKVFYQENTGPIGARKKGLMESKGEYVTFVDADDFVAKKSFVLALESIQRNIDIILFGITRYYYNTKKKLDRCTFAEGIYNRHDIEKELWPQMIWDCEKERFGIDPSLCNKIMKRDLLADAYQNLKDSHFHYGEDVAIVYPLLKRARTIEIRNVSYYYHRQRKDRKTAAYIEDSEYFSKLYSLYKYLLEQFSDMPVMIKQIEYFYMYSINLRKRIYNDLKIKMKYLFPFGKVEKNDDIVIYGAGAVGQNYVQQLRQTDYCKIALWVDQNYKQYHFDDICGIERIKDAKFDKVVIAIEDADVSCAVKTDLISLGISQEQIVEM